MSDSHAASDSANPDDEGILEELASRMEQAENQGNYLSALRIARELRRRALGANQVFPYLRSNFRLTNYAQDLLDPESGR